MNSLCLIEVCLIVFSRRFDLQMNVGKWAHLIHVHRFMCSVFFAVNGKRGFNEASDSEKYYDGNTIV